MRLLTMASGVLVVALNLTASTITNGSFGDSGFGRHPI